MPQRRKLFPPSVHTSREVLVCDFPLLMLYLLSTVTSSNTHQFWVSCVAVENYNPYLTDRETV